MEKIEIAVYKQMDGYTFSISPTVRQLIRNRFPNSFPANLIFVGYDTLSNFDVHYDRLENHIYPALLGIDNKSDLNKIIDEISFVDSQSGKVLHRYKLSA